MNYKQYQHQFEQILGHSSPTPPYDKSSYIEIVNQNLRRMKKWDNTLELSEELVAELKKIDKKQHWIMIAEPWCLEASHILPFLVKMAEESECISYDIQLRDSEPFLINAYLTNGTKGIPKMVVRDEDDSDLFVWGPRPAKAQTFRDELVDNNLTSETIKQALLQWYSADKGKSLNTEILQHYQYAMLSV